jgi:hypothetical protein
LMENPQNSLVAMQSRFVWLVKLLERAKIPVPCPYAVLYISWWCHWITQILSTHSSHWFILTLHDWFDTKIFKIAFWMRKHLSKTLKRTWICSTSNRIAKLDLGPLLPWERVTKVKTTIRKKDKNGQVKWQGSKDLKATQHLDSTMMNWFSFFKLNCFPFIWSPLIGMVYWVLCKWSSLLWTRQYTWRFARHMVELFPKFIEDEPHKLLPADSSQQMWTQWLPMKLNPEMSYIQVKGILDLEIISQSPKPNISPASSRP